MRNLLIVTTTSDLSLPLFFAREILAQYQVTVKLWEDFTQVDLTTLPMTQVVYLRDPFNSGLAVTDVLVKAKQIFSLSQTKNWEFIDRLSSADDLLWEDKLKQITLCPEFFPETWQVKSWAEIDFTTQFVKKRISSRGAGIIFAPLAHEAVSDYIVQNKLKIKTEYRVLTVRGQVLPKVVIKSSKTPSQKIKMLSGENITSSLLAYTQKIQAQVKFELVGYDIAQLENGAYQLIEINRSPQITNNNYYRFTKINAAALLLATNAD